MPWRPLRLLLAYDDVRGLVGRVVPRLDEMLQDRGFAVQRLRLDGAPPEAVDLGGFAGLVLGTPCFGLGVRGAGPTEAVTNWIRAQGDLAGLRTAVFCVYRVRPGHTLRNTRQVVLDQGGQVVVTHAYPMWPDPAGEHTLPAECMVRIR